MIRQRYDGEYVVKKYGPFVVNIPENLSVDDIYKYLMYILLTKKFNILSGEYIDEIGGTLIPFKKSRTIKHKMGSLKLESYFLSKQKPIRKHGENLCVYDYVWSQVQNKRGFKNYTFDKLKNEIDRFVEGDDGRVNTEELVNWVKKCHPRVSIHAYDMRYKNFLRHTNGHPDIVLVYIVKDHHCHPITNEKLKLIASKANQGKDLFKHMIDLKWSKSHDKVKKLKNSDDIALFGGENHVLILPKEMKIQEAIETYIISKNYYVEYLHWSNNGVLDGFIDHAKNMYCLNDEYDTRKSICKKLFKIYKIDDFTWSNQSYTSLANSLFKQMCGYLPESNYNVQARQMLDDFYPRAMQWCTDDEIPDDVLNIDICKCYPSILLHNNQPIPVYTIHDTIKPFTDISQLDHCDCGEFYLDETVLNRAVFN